MPRLFRRNFDHRQNSSGPARDRIMKRNDTERQWNILSLIRWSEDYLAEKGMESPRLNAELLLAHALGYERLDLYTRFDKPLVREELDRYKSFFLRRVNGEPLQYILGYREWYGRRFAVRPGVLIPRPETEHLLEAALEIVGLIETDSPEILDIGTGTGCIAITLALEIPGAQILAVDRAYEARDLATENSAVHGVTDRVSIEVLDILRENVPGDRTFDIVVANPPYIPVDEWSRLPGEIRVHEPERALTDGGDGLTFYRRFAEIAGGLLNEQGWLLCEVGHNQAGRVTDLFRRHNAGEIRTWNDLSGITRIIGGSW
jgi:release factor glutamine methyltransferase